ncbi:histone H1-like [Coregonus clupeaformis]|uniref:histone H1-like n=1 Tax=Coregonus clupeaformis TaxID=59861 RepID=UPI001E1C85BC|nr:histone H1-like [Coregonus clupeaformis]
MSRGGVSLAALKKTLAAGGYDVEKNNSRVKIAVKSLVTKGTLVQTKGTRASGSFKLNKKAPRRPSRKKSPKKAKKPATPKKGGQSPKKVKKPLQRQEKAAKSPKKATKAAKPKAAKPKAAKAKKAAPKKK